MKKRNEWVRKALKRRMCLSPECLAGLRKKMVKHLIRGKSFNRGKLLGKYWRIILDGTGLSVCSGTGHGELPRKEVEIYFYS